MSSIAPDPSPTLPARVERTKGKRARTREALLRAARMLIAERGTSASIDDLVRLAGVARGTFYNYFDTWDAVVKAVALGMESEVESRIDRRMQPDWPASTRVACALRGFIQMAVDDPTTGWAWIRIGPSMHWILADSPAEHSCSYEALDCLVTDRMPRHTATCMVAGTAFLAVRRVLEGVLDMNDLDGLTRMVLHALNAPPEEVEEAVRHAQAFAALITSPNGSRDSGQCLP